MMNSLFKNIIISCQLKKATTNLIRSYSSGGTSLVKVSQIEGLRVITLNDPKTRNALSLGMMNELISAVKDDNSDQLRCIVLNNAAPPVFSSGHNLKELTSDNGIAAQKNIFATCSELMLAIRNSPVPVIASVNGLAAAAGCQLVAACDFAFCTEQSTFSTPGANFGLFCSTPGVPLSRRVNTTTAAYMLMTGDTIDSAQALSSGLVSKVVGNEAQMEATIQRSYTSIKSKSRSVIALGKQFFYEQLEMKYEIALKEGEGTMVGNLQLKDAQEGLQSFKMKRKASWSHSNERIS